VFLLAFNLFCPVWLFHTVGCQGGEPDEVSEANTCAHHPTDMMLRLSLRDSAHLQWISPIFLLDHAQSKLLEHAIAAVNSYHVHAAAMMMLTLANKRSTKKNKISYVLQLLPRC